MRWRKLGRVYCPNGEFAWMRQYAHLPTPIVLEPGKIRVYFAGLDEQKYGRIGYVDVDANEPTRVLAVSSEPVLDLGEPGMFDDCGVNPSCIVRVGDRLRMYYIGWQRSRRVPYFLFAGLAESVNGERFERVSRTPILERTNAEPFVRSATSVLHSPLPASGRGSGGGVDREAQTPPPNPLPEAGRGIYRAWYVSALDWVTVNGEPYPRYVVRSTESPNSVNWSDGGQICIDLQGDEFGIGRPWVVRDADRYRMWYSIRSRSRPYRIGYAESNDGLKWTRMDDRVGIAASESGWDSEMICYAAVIDVNGKRLMFYNGNRHGATGFGVAVLE